MTAVVAGTLAVAIGLSTATFSVLYAVRIKPLPFADPQRLVAVWLSAPPYGTWGMFPATAETLKERSGVFGDITWWIGISPQLSGSGDAEELGGAAVSASFFNVFGVHPQLGRTFRPGDDQVGGAHVVVIGERIWRRRFAADATIVGQRITLDGDSYEIIGVMPATFRFPADTEIWLPRRVDAAEQAHSGPGPYEVVARLTADITRPAAEQRVNRAAAEMAFDPGTPSPISVQLMPLNDVETGDLEQPLLLLLGAVLLVLLIACANTSNLLAARGVQRRLEFAVRMSLGATPRHLISQLVSEGFILSGLGVIGGLMLAWWLLRLLINLGHASVPRIDEATLSMAVITFAILITVSAGILASVIPAWVVVRGHAELTGHGIVETPASWRGSIRAIAGEIATTIVLLCMTSLLVVSLMRALRVDSGLHLSDALVARLRLTGREFATERQRSHFYASVLTDLRAAVGPETPVALASEIPLRGGGSLYPLLSATGEPVGQVAPVATSDRYFSSLGIPIRAGRDFTGSDTSETQPVAVVDEKAAALLGGHILGQRITVRWPPREISAVVVGVVGNVRTFLILPPSGHVYLPIAQRPPARTWLIVPGAAPYAMLPIVKRILHDEDSTVPLAELSTVKALVSNQTAWMRFQTVTLGAFAAVAVWLTALGVAGVIAQSVGYRTREIGIRRALGATEASVQLLIMRQTLVPVLVGVLVGHIAAINAAGLLRWSLFQIRTSEPWVYVGVTVVVVAVAALASYVPARAATVVDPALTLRM